MSDVHGLYVFLVRDWLYRPDIFGVTGCLYDNPYELWRTASGARWSPQSAYRAPGRRRPGAVFLVLLVSE